MGGRRRFAKKKSPTPPVNGVATFAGGSMHPSPSSSQLDRLDREKIVLWRRPLTTIHYSVLELWNLLFEYSAKLLRYRKAIILTILLTGLIYAFHVFDGPHQRLVAYLERKFLWSAYWVGLGVL